MSRLLLVAVAALLLFAPLATAQQNTLTSSGTGFVVDPRGYIITNEHVVHLAQNIKVHYLKTQILDATVISVDAQRDLALLKVSPEKPLPSLPVGSSATARRQQQILVMGFPFGESEVTSTSGRIVSIRTEGAEQVLVTDAVVNPGNSGGPMINDKGEVIGVIKSLLIANIDGNMMKAGEYYAIPTSFMLPMLAAIPDFDFTAIGKATQSMDVADVDSKSTPAVVQITSDRVETPQIGGTATDDQKAFQENALALLKSDLDRMELKYEVDETHDYPVLDVAVKMDNATHALRIVIDSKRQLVYMFLNRMVMAPPDSANLPAITQRLMELNWELNVGKFEWDKTDGEVRLSFTFTTENGVGFEAFQAIVRTLLETGDNLWPELNGLVGGEAVAPAPDTMQKDEDAAGADPDEDEITGDPDIDAWLNE